MATIRSFGNMLNEDTSAFKRKGSKSPEAPSFKPKKKKSIWDKIPTKGQGGY